MRTAKICPTCATFENALCILYNGIHLPITNISPLDSMEVALNKIETRIPSQTGLDAPTNSAYYLGQLYLDTVTKMIYYAVNVGTGIDDWAIVPTIPQAGLAQYTDNLSARLGGLRYGQLYRNGDNLMIVH